MNKIEKSERGEVKQVLASRVEGTDTVLAAFEQCHRDYLNTLDTVWDGTCKRLELTYQECAKEWHDALAGGRGQTRFTEIMQMLVRGVRAAWDDSQREYDDALRAFARSFQQAWAGCDTSRLDARALATIAASLDAVGRCADLTMGNWGLLQIAGVDPYVLRIAALRDAA